VREAQERGDEKRTTSFGGGQRDNRGREEDLVESKLRGAVWKCKTECGR
jgi:hypothetical protein